MEIKEDLSWSGIVDFIQSENSKGADLLDCLAIELEDVRKELFELEDKTNRVKNREKTLLRAGQDVAKHLKKELPLAVQRQGYIVVLSTNNLSIERNVI